MDVKSLKRIERLNYLLGGVAVVASAFFLPRNQLLGLFIGVFLGSVNFTLISRIVQKWLGKATESTESESDSESDKKSVSGFFLIPKMMGLMAAVFVALFFLPISPAFLAIGFSVFLISIAIETARSLTTVGHSEAENGEA